MQSCVANCVCQDPAFLPAGTGTSAAYRALQHGWNPDQLEDTGAVFFVVPGLYL